MNKKVTKYTMRAKFKLLGDRYKNMLSKIDWHNLGDLVKIIITLTVSAVVAIILTVIAIPVLSILVFGFVWRSLAILIMYFIGMKELRDVQW